MKEETEVKFWTTITIIGIFGMIFFSCLLFRNNEVYDLRTEMLDDMWDEDNGYIFNELMERYDSISYERMLFCGKTMEQMKQEWDDFVEEKSYLILERKERCGLSTATINVREDLLEFEVEIYVEEK